MHPVLGYLAFGFGASISLLNFYLSWIRVPLLRGLGRSPRWVSGFPIIGSLLLVISAVLLRDWPRIAFSALALAALDTGGIHCFVGRQLWHALRLRYKKPNA
jgi:hypothetical protein